MSRKIMQQALEAFEEIMFTKNVGSSHIIAKNARYALRKELAKPANEFHPDWDTLKPYHDRIAELEAQLAKPEQPDLRKAAEMALDALENNLPLIEDYGSKEQLNIHHKAIAALYKTLAQPEQDHGFDRTASHMAGEYVDTAQSKAMHEACIEASMRNAQPEQEPVAWQVMVENEPMKEFSIKDVAHDWAVAEKRNGSKYSYWIRPLYTAPPKREWQGLTDEDLVKCYEKTGHYQTLRPQDSFAVLSFARAIIAKLREKNG